MLLMLLIFGSIFLIVSLITLRWPPKKVNPLRGYRSDRAMQSFSTYRAAQLQSSRIFRNFGGSMIALSVIGRLTVNDLLSNMSDGWIVLLFMLMVITMLIVNYRSTESYLKKNFDSSGNPIKNN